MFFLWNASFGFRPGRLFFKKLSNKLKKGRLPFFWEKKYGGKKLSCNHTVLLPLHACFLTLQTTKPAPYDEPIPPYVKQQYMSKTYFLWLQKEKSSCSSWFSCCSVGLLTELHYTPNIYTVGKMNTDPTDETWNFYIYIVWPLYHGEWYGANMSCNSFIWGVHGTRFTS